jgi:tellurite resistance protein TerC
VLGFIGTKMLLIDIYKIPVPWALGTVAAILGVTVALSLARPQKADSAA